MLVKRLLHAVLFLFAFVKFYGQAPYVECKLDTNSILIGEQTDLKLSVLNLSEDDSVQFPIFKDTLHKNIEIINSSLIDTLKTGNSYTHSLSLTITSFDSGYYAIAPIQTKVNGQEILSEALLLEVRNVSLDSLNLAELEMSDLNDIKDVYEDPFSIGEFFQVYGLKIVTGISVIGLFAFMAWFLFLRNPAVVEEKIVPEVKQPDHEIALNRLNEIIAEKYWQNGQVKTYHTEVTETVRNYLESRFNIHAMEQTSGEIIQQMKYADISNEAQNQLVRMLKLADMVKFAKEKPSAQENSATMDLALAFVKLTKRDTTNEPEA